MTLLEVLIEARINLVDNHRSPLSTVIGRQQLESVVTLLEKGYSLEDDFEEITDGFAADELEYIPNKQK